MTAFPGRAESSAPPYWAFDRAAEFYDSTRWVPPALLRSLASFIAHDLPRVGPRTMLDAGVGTGRVGRHMAALRIPVVGVDVSRPMLAKAARVRGLSVALADARALPFPAGSFGSALIVHLLHLISDWQIAVGELRRVVQPAAPIYLVSECGRSFRTRQIYFEIANRRRLVRPNLGAPTVQTIIDLVQKAGATVRRMDEDRLTWTLDAPVVETLAMLDLNPFSQLWHVSAEEHSELMEEVRETVLERYIRSDDIEQAPAQLSVWRVAFPD